MKQEVYGILFVCGILEAWFLCKFLLLISMHPCTKMGQWRGKWLLDFAYPKYVCSCVCMYELINTFLMWYSDHNSKRLHLHSLLDPWVWRRHQKEIPFLLIVQEILQDSMICQELMILSIVCIVVLFLKMFLMLFLRKIW